jgi:hypothetical protein
MAREQAHGLLDDLVPGTDEQVQATLRWLTEVGRHLEDMMEAIRATQISGREVPAAEREIVVKPAVRAAETLRCRPYENAVIPDVAARHEPYVAAAISACYSIAEKVPRDPLDLEAVCEALSQIRLAHCHLKKLMELLVVAKGLRERQPADDRPAGRRGRQLVTQAALEKLLGPENAKVLKIAQSGLSVDDRIRAICAIDIRFISWDSRGWAELLGVADGAVRNTPYWKEDRKRAIAAQKELEGE